MSVSEDWTRRSVKMRNLKTAAKIGVGFGLVIAIAMAIGAIAIWNMLGVQGDARRLDRETVPQVELANSVERSAELAMYNMHGYALTAQNTYLMQANGFLDQTRSHLAEAEELAARSPRLIVLRKNTAEAIARVEDYKKLSADLVTANNDILSARLALDSASSSFMEKSLKLLEAQNQQMAAAVRAGAGSGGIERWMARVNGISGIILLGTSLDAAAYKAQALGDASILKRAIEDFAGFDDKAKALSSVTLAADKPALEQIRLDAEAELAACSAVLANMTKVGDLTSMSAGATDVLLAAASQTSVEGFKDAHAITTLAVTRMVTALFSLLAGLAAAAFIGIAIAIAISRAITRPLARAVAFAQRVAGGDFSQQLPIHQRDEVGLLAEALNGMAQKLRETVNSVQQNAAQVASSSEQISASAQKLSDGAQSQASTLEETSASM
ncbi:MAG TPA: methyl-accepting chemotaxis protein, partial [Spirochaetia bacterium]|nr:methyl-accepting chemotaxis protein [Spirochaetia bacterium]